MVVKNLQLKNYDGYLHNKIVIRRIGHNLILALDTNNLFCVCDVYMLILKNNINLNHLIYLEGLLNSSLINFYDG